MNHDFEDVIGWKFKPSSGEVLHVVSSTSRKYPSVSNPLFVNYRLTMRLVYRGWVAMPG